MKPERLKGLRVGQLEELETLRHALDAGHVKDWSVAVDGGAHVGGWTQILAQRFDAVHAFEPAPDTFKLLQENMAGLSNVRLYQLALMDARQYGTMRVEGVRTTARRFDPKDGGDVLAVGLDELGLPSCGLLKLDLEGCDFFALQGAEKTIRRHRPFLIVELGESLSKGLSERFGVGDADVRKWLRKRGYREVFSEGVNVGYAPA